MQYDLLRSFALLASLLFAAGCDIDNYDPPQADLEGAVAYQGEYVGVRQGAIDLEIWEDGYELRDYIPLNVHQDGTFGAKLFDGEYQVVRQAGAPWVTTTDSVVIQVSGDDVRVTRGDAEVDENGTLVVSVTPYFTLRDLSVTLDDDTVTATFDVEQVVSEAELQQVGLYVNRTRFVGAIGNGNVAASVVQADALAGRQGIELTLPLSAAQRAGQATMYARVGVQAVDAPESLYSPVFELTPGEE